MKVSVTSWSFPLCTLVECAAIARALKIDALDIGYFYRSALNKERLLLHAERYAEEVTSVVGTPASLYHLFGNGLLDRNLAGAGEMQENLQDFRAALTFCRRAGVPSIFVLPGVVNDGQTRREAFNASAENLKRLLEISEASGVVLTIEPHVHSCLESPELVLEMLERVPGLRLTLDYAHFHCLGFRQEEIDVLAPYAAHVHLRQARMGVLQCRLEQGTLNFKAILGTLRQANYSGFLALEYVHQDYMNTVFDDVLSETVKMRDLIRAWLDIA